MEDHQGKSYYFLKTVARAVSVLDLFTASDAELGVADAKRVGASNCVKASPTACWRR